MRRFPAASVVVLLSVSLAACSAANPEPTHAPISGNPTVAPDEKAESTEPAAVLEAVLTTAGVDVDGTSVSASGYIAGLVEEGGTCVFQFSSGDLEVTGTANGRADRSTTACGLVTVPYERFRSGTWQLLLEYSALDGQVLVSEPYGLEIP